MIQIDEAHNLEDVETVRELFREYQSALGVDLGFQSFEAEVAELPGDYARPRGRLLVARSDGVMAGCVALRVFKEDTCEMKRLYVRPPFRASGVGRQLAERVIAEARSIGYRRICLDTLPSMRQAQSLYEALGFLEIPAYRHNPVAGTRFLGLDL